MNLKTGVRMQKLSPTNDEERILYHKNNLEGEVLTVVKQIPPQNKMTFKEFVMSYWSGYIQKIPLLNGTINLLKEYRNHRKAIVFMLMQ